MVKYIRKDDDSKLLICLILGNQRVVMVPMMSSLLVHVSWLVNFLSFFRVSKKLNGLCPKGSYACMGGREKRNFLSLKQVGSVNPLRATLFSVPQGPGGGWIPPPPSIFLKICM